MFFGEFVAVTVLKILTDKNDDAAEVGASHRSSRKFAVSVFVAVPARDSRFYVSAVSGDFGFDAERGRGAPTREVRHERTGKIFLVEEERALRFFRKFSSVVPRNGNRGDVPLITHRHRDIAVDVVVDYAGDRAVLPRDVRLVFETVRSSFDKDDFAFENLLFNFRIGHIRAGVFRLVSVYEIPVTNVVARTGNVNVSEFVFAGLKRRAELFKISLEIVEEVVLLDFLKVVRLVIEEHFSVARFDITRTLAAYGRNRQSRVVSGGRTYRSRIGVGDHVRVALLAAEAGAVTVARRGDKAYSAVVYRVVNLSDVRLIRIFVAFSRKSAGRAERHVYRVDFKSYGVLESGDYIFGFSAAVKIGENLHENELRIRSDSVNNFVVAGDDARNVRSVFAVVRENVGVFIGVIVSKRNLLAVINVLYFKTFRSLPRFEIGKFHRSALYVFNFEFARTVGFCDDEFIFFAFVIAGENSVTHIETRIENGGYRSESGIFAGIVVNTGVFVDIDHVERIRRRIGHLRFDAIIRIGKRNRLYAGGFFDFFKIAVNGVHGERV